MKKTIITVAMMALMVMTFARSIEPIKMDGKLVNKIQCILDFQY